MGGVTEPDDSLSNDGAFWSQVREHKVIQWGVAYLGAALALAHGAELVTHALHWPEGVWRSVVIALIVGFPIALTLAWYHGHKGFQQITAGELSIIALLTLIGAVVLMTLVRPADERSLAAVENASARDVEAAVPTAPDAAPPPEASIAVLPFADLSPNSDQEYFADGLSEEILNSLARIRDLKVSGRTSSFYFKGRNESLTTIGEMLGVAHVLEGSVRKAGEELRITVQLTTTSDGYHVWSKTYDRQLQDVFAIQEDIARSVSDALEVSLGVGDLGRVPGMTRDIEAYDAYLAGAALSDATPDALRTEIEPLERAVALDSSFALAWFALRNAYLFSSTFRLDGRSSEEWAAKADAAIAELERVPSGLPYYYLALADRSLNAWKWADAWRHRERAEAAAREDGTTFEELTGGEGNSMFRILTGRSSDAIPTLERAKSRDPLNTWLAFLLTQAYDHVGNLGAAMAEADRGLSLEGLESVTAQSALWIALEADDGALIERRIDALTEIEADPLGLNTVMKPLLDQPAEARAELRRRASTTTDVLALTEIAPWQVYFGAPADAVETYRTNLDLLRSSGRNPTSLRFWSPMMRDMRKLPAFKELVREMGLVDYWREFGWSDFCRPVGDDDFACE